jgi:hypothetical protein
MKHLLRVLFAAFVAVTGVAGLATEAGAIILFATDNVSLYRIDTSTFLVSPVGNYTLAGSDLFIGGLCFDQTGQMWGLGAGSDAHLYRVSSLTGEATNVGRLNVAFLFEGSLAFDPTSGVLYATNEGSSDSPHLLSVSTATGLATDIGPIAGAPGCNDCHDFGGLSFNDAGQLLGIDRVTNALWKIDKFNPAGPGTVQVGAPFGSGIVLGPISGMTRDADNEVTYCYASGSMHLFTVNPVTALPTILHQFGAADPTFYSLAYRGEFPTATLKRSWGSVKALYRP